MSSSCHRVHDVLSVVVILKNPLGDCSADRLLLWIHCHVLPGELCPPPVKHMSTASVGRKASVTLKVNLTSPLNAGVGHHVRCRGILGSGGIHKKNLPQYQVRMWIAAHNWPADPTNLHASELSLTHASVRRAGVIEMI
jgi:hypothetical protein